MHLIPAPWEKTPNSQKELLAALKSGKEFTVTGVGDKWYGSTTTAKELVEQGIAKAQIRYGKNLTKVWYGNIDVQ